MQSNDAPHSAASDLARLQAGNEPALAAVATAEPTVIWTPGSSLMAAKD
jgi:hypothetical protein